MFVCICVCDVCCDWLHVVDVLHDVGCWKCTAVSLNSSGRGFGQRGRATDQRCVCVRAYAHLRRFVCSSSVGSFGPAPFSIPKFMVNALFMHRRGVGPDSSNWRDHSEPAHGPQAISPSHPTAHEKCVEYLSKGKTQTIMCIVCCMYNINLQ